MQASGEMSGVRSGWVPVPDRTRWFHRNRDRGADRTCRRNCIPVETPAKPIAVIRDVQTVLKSCGMHMVTELLQTLNLVVLQKIGDKNIVGSGGQFFFGTGCMQHAVHHPSIAPVRSRRERSKGSSCGSVRSGFKNFVHR